MDFTNLNNQYATYWAGTDTTNYINIIDNVSYYLNQLDSSQNIYDNTILQPQSLYNAVMAWKYSLPLNLQYQIIIPDNINYSDLYDFFTYHLYLKYDTATTANVNNSSWIIDGLKQSMTDFENIGKGAINTISFLTNPYILAIAAIILIYFLINK